MANVCMKHCGIFVAEGKGKIDEWKGRNADGYDIIVNAKNG